MFSVAKKEKQISWESVLKKEVIKRPDNFMAEFFQEFNRHPDEKEFEYYCRFKNEKPLFPRISNW